VKERPIIMTAESVRAILAGRKTQTRRVVKIRPPLNKPPYYTTGIVRTDVVAMPGAWLQFRYDGQPFDGADFLLQCPYGQPGDVLWVKEAFTLGITPKSCVGGKQLRLGPDYDETRQYAAWYDGTPDPWGWFYDRQRRSPLFMPRWASRLTLRLTDVRVERVQEISEEDAMAEGIECWEDRGYDDAQDYYRDYRFGDDAPGLICPIESYRTLWDTINASRGFPWDSNPWVWVLAFEEVHP
jgi:hypothetical protein